MKIFKSGMEWGFMFKRVMTMTVISSIIACYNYVVVYKMLSVPSILETFIITYG